MMTICADAGFLIGLYDQRDDRHDRAVEDFVKLFGSGANRLLIPWPILYETVSTRMARNLGALAQMDETGSGCKHSRRLSLSATTLSGGRIG
jgi:predicted nucleic acid-binding protein